jgi:hypothetical protein
MARTSQAQQEAELLRLKVREMLLAPENGFRKYVFDILGKAGIFQTSLRPDPYLSAAAEGRRNLGLELLAELEVAQPGALLILMNEAGRLPGAGKLISQPQEGPDERYASDN